MEQHSDSLNVHSKTPRENHVGVFINLLKAQKHYKTNNMKDNNSKTKQYTV